MTTSVQRLAGGSLADGNFIDEVWDAKLNNFLRQQTSLEKITNNEYGGGLLHKGGVVHIRSEPRGNVFDYVVGQEMPVDVIDDNKIELQINKAKAYNTFIDDIDLMQTNIPLVNALTSSYAYSTKIAIEQDVYGSVYADAGTSMTQTVITKVNSLEWALTASAYLSRQGVAPEDRWLVVPSFVALQMQLSDVKAVNIMGGNESVARKAIQHEFLGYIGGMKVYQSEQIAEVNGVYQCMAGGRRAICYAAQFQKSETFKSEKRMGTGIRGLTVYGYKVIQPNALVHMPCTVELGF